MKMRKRLYWDEQSPWKRISQVVYFIGRLKKWNWRTNLHAVRQNEVCWCDIKSINYECAICRNAYFFQSSTLINILPFIYIYSVFTGLGSLRVFYHEVYTLLYWHQREHYYGNAWCIVYTYKVKRHFFRHGRRTAPKFCTHVRIETRLALT